MTQQNGRSPALVTEQGDHILGIVANCICARRSIRLAMSPQVECINVIAHEQK